MSNEDRWKQRLQNLKKAFKRLEDACDKDEYSELETAGLVQTYEFTFELAWKTMKDKLTFEGYDVKSPRSTIKKAFEMELIVDVDDWLEALETRNLFTHTYDEDLAEQAIEMIKEKLKPMLEACVEKLNELAEDE